MRLAGGERIATSTVNTAFSSLSGSFLRRRLALNLVSSVRMAITSSSVGAVARELQRGLEDRLLKEAEGLQGNFRRGLKPPSRILRPSSQAPLEALLKPPSRSPPF